MPQFLACWAWRKLLKSFTLSRQTNNAWRCCLDVKCYGGRKWIRLRWQRQQDQQELDTPTDTLAKQAKGAANSVRQSSAPNQLLTAPSLLRMNLANTSIGTAGRYEPPLRFELDQSMVWDIGS